MLLLNLQFEGRKTQIVFSFKNLSTIIFGPVIMKGQISWCKHSHNCEFIYFIPVFVMVLCIAGRTQETGDAVQIVFVLINTSK